VEIAPSWAEPGTAPQAAEVRQRWGDASALVQNESPRELSLLLFAESRVEIP
jgi:hypothetical protein